MSIAQNPQKRHLSEFIGSQKPPDAARFFTKLIYYPGLSYAEIHRTPD
ncbi:hypothetical protein BofuT4_uP069800.1 [Botrytis cinerea T4]|uniref:Uncharacterized protein n=1 Tax=Botryotinia fuckeliana (strain T4) TaxID=999810 RepID=G2XQN5_BOTF4|nr:hypothetical protein BofuT4_uP069800.1 [Botrytis cinerea T4]